MAITITMQSIIRKALLRNSRIVAQCSSLSANIHSVSTFSSKDIVLQPGCKNYDLSTQPERYFTGLPGATQTMKEQQESAEAVVEEIFSQEKKPYGLGENIYSLRAQRQIGFSRKPFTDIMRRQIETASLELSGDGGLQESFQKSKNLDFWSDLNSSSLVYSLSFAQPEDDSASLPLTKEMKTQLANVEKNRTSLTTYQSNSKQIFPSESSPMHQTPKTLTEALLPSSEARVITETSVPFRITHVNSAWEKLCGYTSEEACSKTLGMLQGPETDLGDVTALLSQLLKGNEASTVLTNYDKKGRRFRNRLRVAPLMNQGMLTHFIGILEEIKEKEDRIRN